MSRLRIGIALYESLDDARRLEEIAQAVEELGFDGLWVGDHPTATRSGGFADPLTVLPHLAASTGRLRLGTSVLVLPYRNPVLVANQAATLDRLAPGRFVLGIGAGHDRDEFASLGVPFAERGPRTDEGLEVLHLLWQGRPVSYEGRFTKLADTRIGTVPATLGGPPVWVGGNSEAALVRAVRYGRAWHGLGLPPQEIKQVARRIGDLAARDGRQLEGFELTMLHEGSSPATLVPDVEGLMAAGLTTCLIGLNEPGPKVFGLLERIANHLVPGEPSSP